VKIGLVVAPGLPDYTPGAAGGIPTYVADLGRALSARHQVIFLTHCLEPSSPGEYLGCRVEPIFVPPSMCRVPHTHFWAFALRTAHLVRRLVARGELDIVETPGCYGFLSLYLPARRIPVITRLVTSLAQVEAGRVYRSLAKRLIHRYTYGPLLWLERRGIQLSDYLIAPSRQEIEAIRSFFDFDTPVEVIPFAVRLDGWHDPIVARQRIAQEYGIAEGRPIVLFLGTLQRRKGIDYLLQAAQRVHRQVPEAVFVLVGPDHWEGGAGRLITETFGETPEYVRLIGLCDEARKRDWLAACDLTLMPSRWESFGLVPIESMANRKPSVCFAIGGPVETAQDNPGVVAVPPFDVEALAQAVVRLLVDEEERRRRGEAGRKVAEERYSLDTFARRTEKLYEQVLSNWRPPRGR
jgi:glycosyltransferase involved in cell wall biosynthesis